MCGQPTAYNTYATLSYTNPQFMGFSRSQNVSFGSQRDNSREYQEYITLRNFGSGVFFMLTVIE